MIRKPALVREDVQRILTELAHITDDYSLAYRVAYSQQRTGDPVKGSGPSDPTGQTAGDHGSLRYTLRRVARELLKAEVKITQATKLLEVALQDDERRHEIELDRRNVRTASLVDVQQSREAQKRRKERGERWGD